MPHEIQSASLMEQSSRPKAFQFIEGRPTSIRESQDAEKENRAISTECLSQKQLTAPQSSPRRPWPSTPATRLPLSDLIGDSDDKYKGFDLFEISPQDQIVWQAVRSPQRSNPKQAPVHRKRHRSSSPPSSSQRKSSKLGTTNGVFSLDGVTQYRTTPQIDPAIALWNRYTTNSMVDGTPLALPVTNFADILNKSSPQPEKGQTGTVGGLRRWTSCGVEWPTSKAKRRKIRNSALKEEIEGVFTDLPPFEDEEATKDVKRSRIGSIIQRIQDTLNKPEEIEEHEAPSSSSPLPDRSESLERDSLSPTRAPAISPNANDGLIETGQALLQTSRTLANCEDQSQSSGFGSDDLDLDILEIAENTDVTTNTSYTNVTPANMLRNPPCEVKEVPPVLKTSQTLDFEDDDEFGEDIDLSLADFEFVASRYESQPTAAAHIELPPVNRTHRSAVPITLEEDADEFGDEFDDDGIDEASFAAAEAAATQSHTASGPSKSSTERKVQTIQRYRITAIYEGEYTERDQTQPEKVLAVEDDGTKTSKAVILRQSWFDTHCTKGSYVHVIGKFGPAGQCVIDDAHNMLILHPDHLISALVVADSFGCIRRAVLQDRVKATSDASPPTVYGTMLHEIFQEALKANKWDNDWLRATINSVVAKHIEDIYQINLSVPHVTDHLLSKLPVLQSWAEVFIQARPKPNAMVKDRNGKSVIMSINKLLDVEEHVWSPMYGLKGNIDATVQVTMEDEEGLRILTMPLELKTGKNTSSASHRAQTALYTLLLSDRYDVAIAYGILYYMETSEVTRIPAIRHELRHMIMQRNELACYVRERLSLPPMLKNNHMCHRCYAKDPCFLYHKLVESGTGETSGLKEKFDEVVRHLKPVHQDFFKKWDHLLTKEESEMMKFRRELWTMLSDQREKLGRCFGNIVLEPGSEEEDQGGSKINRFRYSFRKHELQNGFSFAESQIITGEPIVISDEHGHYALAKGYVVGVQNNRISVAVDRRLHNARSRLKGFDEDVNQTFSAIMDVEGTSVAAVRSQPQDDTPVLYRLDKDEFSNGMATVRNNLIQVMSKTVFHAEHIRRLVVEGIEPKFKVTPTAYSLTGPASQLAINGDQRAAIEKAMTAEDYALVLGMPGTGKTTTIAHIIRALVAKGKSVLLTSYTHTAVDNILLKIRQDNISILRLGAVAKIHPEVREFAILGAEPKGTIEELQKTYHEPQVVATTCLGVNHALFNSRIFDYCIVDEASQITLPVCLGPIRMAKAFVLVGDHYQLPPLVQNREAQEGGLDVSLFKLLSERHPSAVVVLRHQYRMNAAIMSISNALIYFGQLVCGSEAVASRILNLPHREALAKLHTSRQSNCSSPGAACWLNTALTASDTAPVIFINTDTLLPESREKAQGARITNQLEADLTADLVNALLLCGVTPDAIGVITLYRSQLALIKSLLPRTSGSSHIEAHTADRFQGRDKDIIILSCVRSNDREVVGDLLKDWRRVNVAVTRARRKLIIIGSKSTLSSGDELLGRLVKLCEVNNWMRDLPQFAGDRHAHRWCIDDGAANWEEAPVASVEYVKTAPVRRITTTGAGEDSTPTRIPFQPRTANASVGVKAPFKQPAKVGKMSRDVLLGRSCSKGTLSAGGNGCRRPVLADIVNDILGDE